MNVLLDTHVLVWWYLDAPELPSNYRALLERLESAGERVGVCDISLWEIAKLVERGRLQLHAALDELLQQVEADPLFEVLPLSGRIAAESTRLGPAFHKDPADQLIAATARCLGLRLMTCDEAIRKSHVVAVV
jgi:PIN domain nuclease of toxin-antitoxin system